MKWNDAAAAVAVGVISHHALALVLTGWTKSKSLQTKLAVVGHLLRPVRLHQLEG